MGRGKDKNKGGGKEKGFAQDQTGYAPGMQGAVRTGPITQGQQIDAADIEERNYLNQGDYDQVRAYGNRAGPADSYGGQGYASTPETNSAQQGQDGQLRGYGAAASRGANTQFNPDELMGRPTGMSQSEYHAGGAGQQFANYGGTNQGTDPDAETTEFAADDSSPDGGFKFSVRGMFSSVSNGVSTAVSTVTQGVSNGVSTLSTGVSTRVQTVRDSMPGMPDTTGVFGFGDGEGTKLSAVGDKLHSMTLGPLGNLAESTGKSIKRGATSIVDTSAGLYETSRQSVTFYSYQTYAYTTYLYHISVFLTFLTLLVDLFAVGSLCTIGLEAADCSSKIAIALGLVLPGVLFDLVNVFWIRGYLQAYHEAAKDDYSEHVVPAIFFVRTVEFWLGLFQATFAVASSVTFYYVSGSSCAQSRVVISSLLLAATSGLAIVFDLCALVCRYTFRFVSRGNSWDPEHAWFQYLDYVLMRCAIPVIACLALIITGGAGTKCENATAAYTMAGLLGAAMFADTCLVCFTDEFDDWACRTFRQGTPSIPGAVCASMFCITAWIAAVGMNLFTCLNALFVTEMTILGLMTIGAAIAVFKAATFSGNGPATRDETTPLVGP